jgi:Tfp pilus assembly protein PilO
MNLQNMAPNAKRAMLLTLAFGGLAAAIYFFAVEPTEERLYKVRKSLAAQTQKHQSMMTSIGRSDQVKQRLGDAEARVADYDKALIKPLLESTAMRAKSFVDALAIGCELSGMEYEALDPLDLPVLDAAPQKKYARCPIRIACRGSYQSAVSFVRCVEREFPLVALESMSVTSQQDASVQQVVIVIEWPMVKEEVAK